MVQKKGRGDNLCLESQKAVTIFPACSFFRKTVLDLPIYD